MPQYLPEGLVLTAWRMGHALRLMAARQHMLDGTLEVDHFISVGD